MLIRQDMAQIGAEWLKDTASDARILTLSGKGGRRFLAKHIARQLGKGILLVDLAKCENPFGEDTGRFWGKLVHTAFLYGALVCIYGITSSLLSQYQITGTGFETTAVHPFLEADCSVILCTETGMHLTSDRKYRVRTLEFVKRQEKSGRLCFMDLPKGIRYRWTVHIIQSVIVFPQVK